MTLTWQEILESYDPAIFYGKWTLTVLSVAPGEHLQRLRIANSTSHDGTYPGQPGEAIAEIDGEEWGVALEHGDPGEEEDYMPVQIERTPGVRPGKGLVVTLATNNQLVGSPPSAAAFTDLVVQLVYLDPATNPPGVETPPYEFTLPSSGIWPKKPPPDGPPCCCCHCRSHQGSAPAQSRGCR
jgi:hypothetical protein